MTGGVLIAFAYEVGPGAAADFERVYGRDGEWAQFFRADSAYLGSELRRCADDPSRYLVFDHWASREAYAAFLGRHREEYDRRSRASEALYRRETPLGRFLPSEPGPGVALELLPGTLAICRLEADAAVPAWAQDARLLSLTRTDQELSIVVREEAAPADVVAERGWRCLRVAGPLDFALTGVAAALAGPLATARVPLLLVATYDTDLVLVRAEHLGRALAALAAAGHRVPQGDHLSS